MRTIAFGLFLLVSSLSFSGCNKKDKTMPTLSPDKTAINATAQAGKDYLQVSSNTDWTLSGMPSWLTVTPASGKGDARIELSFPVNTGTEALVATLTLSGVDVNNSTITFTQMGSTPSLLADKTTANEKAEGQADSLLITSNVPWKLDIPVAANWITADKTTGPAGVTKVMLTIAANSNSSTRTGNLSLTSTGPAATPVTIAISQLQAPVVITTFTAHGKGGDTITITGSGFSSVLEENIVKINDKPAIVTAVTPTSLRVKVPVKAGDGKISLTIGTSTNTTAKNFYYDWVGVVTTVAGTGGEFILGYPGDVARDAAGNLYISDTYSHCIRKISPDGTNTNIAGGGRGFADGNGANARFYYPSGIALDANGNLFVADMQNHAIRKISAAGVVTTIAGNGAPGAVNGNGTAASFNNPAGIAVDANGNVFVSDQFNHMIRKISPAGDVTNFAGSTTRGAADGIGSAASFSMPYGMTFDGNGNLFVADWYNHLIRKITPNANVTTIAGTGVGWVDGLVAVAKFNYLSGLAIDNEGNIYVADRDNSIIRKISAAGWVSTLAGSHALPYFQDGTGSDAHFLLPVGIAVDGNGTVYIADQSNSRIRKLIQQ